MSKFNRTTTRPAVSSPVTSERTPSGHTYEGAAGYARDAKSELFLLSVSNMVGEDSFYEKAGDRDERFRNLVQQCAIKDPIWTFQLLRWLRSDGNMRSASLVGAAEFVRATTTHKAGTAPFAENEVPGMSGERALNRAVVDVVCQRADEPGEMLAYWTSTYGRNVPQPVKRGVADAVRRLYNEYSLSKYDSQGAGFRFGDVIDLVHPTAGSLKQGDLYEHALDRRHNRDKPIPESLSTLRARAELMSLSVAERRSTLLAEDGPEQLNAAGITWEALAGWLQGPMDANAWSAIIPNMPFMSLLRNLRNFDEAGVSDEIAEQVAARLADPEQVARSRQLPMRFLSAYRAAPSLRWAHPLDKALTASIGNIPRLKGRTLVLVDTSTSMQAGFSKDGTLMRWDAAALFGVALGQRCENADVVSFSSMQRFWGDPVGANTKQFPLRKGESLLRSVERWKGDGYFLGGGTDTEGALRQHFAGHDRVVILTDEQAEQGDVGQAIPQTTPLITFNLAGHRYGHAPSGTGLRVTIGGLSDAGFQILPLLEAGRNATWPWAERAAA